MILILTMHCITQWLVIMIVKLHLHFNITQHMFLNREVATKSARVCLLSKLYPGTGWDVHLPILE